MEKTDISGPLRELYRAINQQDSKLLESVVTEDVEMIDYGLGETVRGREAFKAYFKNWWTAFPRGSGELKKVLVVGDELVAEIVGRGEQSGPFETKHGRVEASNRVYDFHFCKLVRIRDGKIASMHAYSDASQMLASASTIRGAA